jgi:hypothetical protein
MLLHEVGFTDRKNENLAKAVAAALVLPDVNGLDRGTRSSRRQQYKDSEELALP